jgi:polysaccharide export outer membrane protein
MTKASMINRIVRSIAVLLGILLVFSAVRAGDDYPLGAGDVVKITVFDYPDLTTEARVSESGTITFPLLGEVSVGGLSASESENLIAQQLSSQGFIKQAHVSVIVSQFLSQQISVIGQVNKPGKYPLDKASTITDLLAMAGGVNSNGGDTAILIRAGKDGKKENRKEIDLYTLFQKGESEDIGVFGGDIIYVPRASVFYVYGEVQRPGMYRLERNMTVAQAISVGGGLTPKGTENRLEVKRRDEKGAMQLVDMELHEQLRADDVLYIKESWF